MSHDISIYYTHGTPPENEEVYFRLTYVWSKTETGANIYVNEESETILDDVYNLRFDSYVINNGTLKLGNLRQTAEMTIDEIQIFDVSLTADELKQLPMPNDSK